MRQHILLDYSRKSILRDTARATGQLSVRVFSGHLFCYLACLHAALVDVTGALEGLWYIGCLGVSRGEQ